ncbi:MAG: phosphoribosylformimino-5-aminoimidazole carboxamide ribotide isomerase [Lachnospiraceae bacterium]|nr:phosphoribosylformimino-5-aminoimidazole carboxamide ribotide isomerase [Lachnospiraceae bacterium]
MEFRPCIDIHNGKVKQIVGGSLDDEANRANENFVSKKDALFFANFYAKEGLRGGHLIMLNPPDSPYYEDTKEQAMAVLKAYPDTYQLGGGVNADNARGYIEAGASHVIVTSYVFKDGKINYENLNKLVAAVGKEHIVLDLSCRRRGDEYFVVTDRWQKFTKEEVTLELLESLADYADEFLIHAADVEGKQCGIERDLVTMLSKWEGIPVTYAGGVGDYDDVMAIKELSDDRLNVTVGSALDLFGGPLNYETVLSCVRGL